MMDAKKREEETLKFWKDNKIPEQALAMRKGKPKYYFLDGPPYATGYIHLGTAWNKILKDVYIRYKRMRGFDVKNQPGYDTHGLPIENKVEKKLGFKSKDDIERLGIEQFNRECRKFATEFIGVMNDQFSNLGVWMDWERPYLTLENYYIEGAWHTFKVGFEKGFLYKDSYSVHVCPHCETAVAYNEIEYAKATDPAVFIKFPVKGKKGEFLLIWTTTPWTLPSNTGIMAKPSADYAYVKRNGETLIMAKELVERVMEKGNGVAYDITKTVKGKQLEGMEYDHPLAESFPFIKKVKNGHRVVLSEQFVTLEDGTGLVHTAPGHGQEDYKVGKESGLPIVSPLKMNGTYDEGCGMYSGRLCKECDDDIMEEFDSKGLLFQRERITHDYPNCWRCSSPLLFMAVPQWFFKVTKIRDKLIAENRKVKWYPEWAGKRFHNWLESLGDWPISRQRYWGIPLPIWVCEECEAVKVIGSSDELPEKPKDMHRPYIDNVIIKCDCGGKMRRIPDVLDVWFDAGLAGWASLGYPKERKEFERLWPSDLNIEGPDQIRGWWNSEFITSVITFGEKPFKSILFHGFVLDAHGAKMSKSLGNIVAPEDVIAKYGRDVLRFYLLSSPPWDDFYFNWKDVENIAKMFNILRNVYEFVRMYVSDVPERPKELNVEDRWIISRLNSVAGECAKSLDNFENHKAIEALQDFILNDFSRWYIKLVRPRTWPTYEGKDRKAAFYTLVHVSEQLLGLMAPLTPFFSEQMYREVIRDKRKSGLKSVHFHDYPKADVKAINKSLERGMETADKLSEAINSARQLAGVKLRWPVEDVVVVSTDKDVKDAIKDLEGVLKFICNANRITLSKKEPEGEYSHMEFDGGKIFISLEESRELYEERLYSELSRKVQEMRKVARMVVEDKITLHLSSSEDLLPTLRTFRERLETDVGAEKLVVGKLEGKQKGKVEFKGKMVEIGF
ncbi:hypothetical protein A3K63_03290 [Candidatus Micrarchaeota archaeon RBG_16_49_10]|nr:MAG: hypothetical protein A3K63_03290 [Candidatus Micrarchaeota archaeon RBG_16_49_10]